MLRDLIDERSMLQRRCEALEKENAELKQVVVELNAKTAELEDKFAIMRMICSLIKERDW